MSKMSETVGEFKFMKDDLNRRLTSLENPKVGTGAWDLGGCHAEEKQRG